MKRHEWHETTDDGKVYHRALHFGRRWQFFTQDADTKEWVEYDEVPTWYLEKFRDVLFNKYQRGRCPWKLVTSIDILLGREPETPK